MPIETTTFERAVHLLLFVLGGIAFATGALYALERVAGGSRRAIRAGHVVAAAAAFVLLAVVEVVFHAFDPGGH